MKIHKRVLKDIGGDPLFLWGAAIFVFVALFFVTGKVLTPYDPGDISFIPLASPSHEHILGINDGGQDIFSELVAAVGNTLLFAFTCGFLTLLAGIIFGFISALKSGITDIIIMRISDILLSIPSVMILVLIAALFRPPSLILAVILALMSWPSLAKGYRSQILVLKESLHVKAAERMGARGFYIVRRHLLPELFPLYLIGFSSKMKMAIFMEVSLAFLGLFDPSRKSLGMMISYSLKYYYMNVWWNWFLPPVFFVSIMIMSVTFIAVSLERAFDPRI